MLIVRISPPRHLSRATVAAGCKPGGSQNLRFGRSHRLTSVPSACGRVLRRKYDDGTYGRDPFRFRVVVENRNLSTSDRVGSVNTLIN